MTAMPRWALMTTNPVFLLPRDHVLTAQSLTRTEEGMIDIVVERDPKDSEHKLQSPEKALVKSSSNTRG